MEFEDREVSSEELTMDAVEGLMSLLQVLVISLGRTGMLDTADYARLLLDYREQHIARESIAEALIDRMLDSLVKEGADVLLRRHSMRLIPPSGTPEQRPTAEVPGLAPGGDGADV